MSFVFRALFVLAAAACLAYPFFVADVSVEMFWGLCAVATAFMVTATALSCRDPLPAHFTSDDSLQRMRNYDEVEYAYDSTNPLSPYYVDINRD